MSAHDWLRDSVAVMLNIDGSRITENARLEADLGADSIDFLEMVMTAEDHFRIAIEDRDLEGVTTFGQAVALIDAKQAAA